jgi:hypothetical protein
MSAQIENLKQELREFIALSKTITQGLWEIGDENNSHYEVCIGDAVASIERQDRYGLHMAFSREEMRANGNFIIRSRNISPAMAECLLGQIEWLEQYAVPVESANQQLQQILTLWEASK